MADMRDRLIELIKEIVVPYFAEQLADHLLANGVISPPCKVGDTVYYISFGKVYKGECHAITLKPTMQIHLYDYDGDNASLKADRVFLTREEAEKALREIDTIVRSEIHGQIKSYFSRINVTVQLADANGKTRSERSTTY